jgi:hypothetical protein
MVGVAGKELIAVEEADNAIGLAGRGVDYVPVI